MNAHTTAEGWNWHDRYGRMNGEGRVRVQEMNASTEPPPFGTIAQFSFAVTDSQGFAIAHCKNPSIPMSVEQIEAHTRRIAAALNSCKGLPTEVLTQGAIQDLREFTEEIAKIIMVSGHNLCSTATEAERTAFISGIINVWNNKGLTVTDKLRGESLCE